MSEMEKVMLNLLGISEEEAAENYRINKASEEKAKRIHKLENEERWREHEIREAVRKANSLTGKILSF